MKYQIKQFFCVMLWSIFAMSAGISGQVVDEKMRIDTNLVLVDVLVFDKTGQVVKGLRPDQFEVFRDNVKQPIDSFSAETAPVSFGIIYDMHPTTSDRTRAVIESLREFKKSLGPDDDLFLIAFHMGGQETFDFVPTVEQLERHLTNPDKHEPRSLYDAVYFASERIQSSRNRKRALLIISDGIDHQSRHTLNQTKAKIDGIKAGLYAVIVDNQNTFDYHDITRDRRLPYFPADASPLTRAALVELTMKTGGGTFIGGSKTSDQLNNIYREIADEMRLHYTLGFYPDVIDGKRHRIVVRLTGVPDSKEYVLVYRKGYRNQAKRP